MIFSTATLTRVCAVSFATAAALAGTMGEAFAQTLNGAGASFPAPLYQRYFADYKN
ncbi:MAG: phosphate ABC transporter substrate-binding protein PstS, partial [Microcystis aeruginosa]